MKPSWVKYLESVPEILQAQLKQRLSVFFAECEKAAINFPQDKVKQLVRVFACSEFVAKTAIAAPGKLLLACEAGELDRALTAVEVHKQIENEISQAEGEEDLIKRLRLLRKHAWLRIAWRDICQQASVEETLAELSTYAESLVQKLIQYLDSQFHLEYGIPVTESGREQSLVVLALGKLGGRELNFSSDIDLIFCYESEGKLLLERKELFYEEYFRRLGQKLINLLSYVSGDGFLFRVDMRLRPYGSSGPLVMSFAGLEEYYQNQGRDWERYALIKARVIAGDREAGQSFLKMIQPFVYRRYLDFDAFESLRDMKLMINREVKRKGIEANIKIGAGGIREIEFITQAFQIVRGGRVGALQSQNLMSVLFQLGENNFFEVESVNYLLEAYQYLPRCENLIQAMDEQQIHALPKDEDKRARLAFAMSKSSWSELAGEVNEYRTKVHEYFIEVFATQEIVSETENPDFAMLELLWSNELSEEDCVSKLKSLGFSEPMSVIQMMINLKKTRSYRIASSRTLQRLDKLIPIILELMQGVKSLDACFQRLLNLIEVILGRSAYIALLVEKQNILPQLIRLFAISPWLSAYLTRHPILLDDLLDPERLYAPSQNQNLETNLVYLISSVDMDDLERQMDILRQFKQSNVLRVAAADVVDALPLMEVSDHLTQIAEVVLEVVFNIAWYQMTSRYGRPQLNSGEVDHSGFTIIAYGKLGGIELGYGSDLDIIFLHASQAVTASTEGPKSIENKVFYIRLAQRIIHILSTQTAAGYLYEIDIRLRPNGSSGLLVSDIDAFADYQRTQAWTWEHQALVRARAVAGDKQLGMKFNKVRTEILSKQLDAKSLRADVLEMRAKMVKHLSTEGDNQFALKHDRGGIADIEFLVQYCVLRFAHEFPVLIEFTDNVRQIQSMLDCGLIKSGEADLLTYAYRAYREMAHRLVLQEVAIKVDSCQFVIYRRRISELWKSWLVNGKFD